jgi:hypothetical protein
LCNPLQKLALLEAGFFMGFDMTYLIQFVLAVLAGMLVAAVFGGGK